MTTIVIYAHPYEDSFNHVILQETQELLAAKNEVCRVIDLYAEGFNPVYGEEGLALFNQRQTLDLLVQRYQQMIKESRRLIFIFPIWWADMPVIVKGLLDKVLLKQLAHVENKTGLKGLLDIDEVLVVSASTAPTFYLRYFCGSIVGRATLDHAFKGMSAEHCRWVNCGRVNLTAQERRQAFLSALVGVIRTKPVSGKYMVNIPSLVAALLLTVAFFTHLIIGTRETLSLQTNGEKDRHNWMQTLCMFQLTSVDLFLMVTVAYLLVRTQMAGVRWEIAYFIAAYLDIWGVVWLIQSKVVGRGGKNYYLLGRWIMFFLCSGLMVWGVQTL